MQRREFLKASCNVCLLGAAGIIFPQLTGCAATQGAYTTEVANKMVTIPVSLFDKYAIQLVRPKGWYYDIAVQKNENNTYSALLLQCTHQENQLTKSGNGYSCSLHGSQFDDAGNVTKGPAVQALQRYTTTINNNELIIHL